MKASEFRGIFVRVGASEEDFAKAMGVKTETINAWLNNRLTIPPIKSQILKAEQYLLSIKSQKK